MKIKYKICLSTISDVLNIKPTHSEISKIIGVSANALSNRLSNDGYLKDEEISKIEKYYNIELQESKKTVELKYYSNNSELIKKEPSKTIFVPVECFENFSISEEYFVISAIGDSMSPYIEDKDKLIVERFDSGQILDNRVYVFEYKGEIFTKRLVKNINQIVVISDNPLYPARMLEGEELKNISIIGQILGLVREVD